MHNYVNLYLTEERKNETKNTNESQKPTDIIKEWNVEIFKGSRFSSSRTN